MLFFGKTDVGKRRAVNQDNFMIKKYSVDVVAALVCDGMGGANGGNIASSVAIDAFYKKLDETEKLHPDFFGLSDDDILNELSDAVCAANSAVYNMSLEDPSLSGMGTTLVGCVVCAEKAYIVNVGDSRLYSVSGDRITQITHDHSYVQYLVDLGKMTPEEAKISKNKNLITRAVGTEKTVVVDVFTASARPGTAFVICSDGLSNLVEPQEIKNAVNKIKDHAGIEDAAASLIDLANDRGGIDNITAVILSI